MTTTHCRLVLRCAVLVLLMALTSACASTQLTPARGLYPTYDDEALRASGFPNTVEKQPYWWPEASEGEWGILYTDDGIPYGPNTYYHHNTRLDHPSLVVTDSTMSGRWFTSNLNDHLPEAFIGRWHELLDLAHQDMVDHLRFDPPYKIGVVLPPTLEDYTKITGKDYWVTQVVNGPHIVFEPPRILFSRTLAFHTVRNAVAQSFLDMKCHGLVPPWLREGIGAYLGEEGNVLLNFVGEFKAAGKDVVWTLEQTSQHVYPLVDREKGRIALYNSFLMTWRLAQSWGWTRIQDLLDAMEQGTSFDRAVPLVYGVSATELMEMISPEIHGEPQGAGFEPTFR